MKVFFSNSFVLTENLDQTASRAAAELLAQDPAPAAAPSAAQFAFSPCFVRVSKLFRNVPLLRLRLGTEKMTSRQR